MFRRLRNKLILINLAITTAVILVVFTAIYIIYIRTVNSRPPMPENTQNYSYEVEKLIEDRIQAEKNTAAGELLIMLIVSGVTIELAVALGSYYLAEQAIKPIREAYEAQKIFIANASHEIKTPLAAISANLEAADIHNNKWIDNVEHETHKLTTINGKLLDLARIDLTSGGAIEDIDLSKIATQIINDMQPRMSKKTFIKNIKVTSKVRLNSADFTQILTILMDNAIKYSDKKIFLHINNHEAIVKNDGAIISDKDLPHIFERFYQADKSVEGVGLGLSIAKSLADRNGWSLTAKSKNNMTEFVLKF